MISPKEKANAAGSVMKTTRHRRAFSLVELLVVITLIVMLVAMMATALNSARASGAKQKTRASIMMLDSIIQQHYRGTESMSVPQGEDRGDAIRKQITADMPDSWAEVAYLQSNQSEFNLARHRGYVATAGALSPSSTVADAECLFMIIMQGGLADCLECAGLGSIPVGDTDNDGAQEFLDAWGEPIRYVLWPGGFELPPGQPFFDTKRPFDDGPPASPDRPGGVMRPLLFSGGPSKKSSTEINDSSYLDAGSPGSSGTNLGGPDGGDDYRNDNITNFDDEVKK
jgi:prepilin-type N-terminal cleavage/methylation domain-containing protein